MSDDGKKSWSPSSMNDDSEESKSRSPSSIDDDSEKSSEKSRSPTPKRLKTTEMKIMDEEMEMDEDEDESEDDDDDDDDEVEHQIYETVEDAELAARKVMIRDGLLAIKEEAIIISRENLVAKTLFPYLSVATASLVNDFYHYPEDLSSIVYTLEKHQQLDKLWTDFTHKSTAEIPDIFEMILTRNINLDSYPLLGEADVASIVRDFSYGGAATFPTLPYCSANYNPDLEEIFHIEQAINKTRAAKITADEYLHLLLESIGARRCNYLKKRFFLDALVELEIPLSTIDSQELPNLYNLSEAWEAGSPLELFKSLLMRVLHRVVFNKQSMIRGNVESALYPCYLLLPENGLAISEEVDLLAQMAECYRRAKCDRFISSDHFISAFRDRGYVLPHWMVPIDDSGTCPPYHIYATSILLAELQGERIVEPEHLAYAVTFAKHVVYDSQQVLEMEHHFKDLFRNVKMYPNVVDEYKCLTGRVDSVDFQRAVTGEVGA